MTDEEIEFMVIRIWGFLVLMIGIVIGWQIRGLL
jgi:hypothetical protein